MTANPYTNPDYAREYVTAQNDPVHNRYEWLVTLPALRQFAGDHVRKFIDYGCGGGIFTAALSELMQAEKGYGREIEAIGTDASSAVLAHSSKLAGAVRGLTYQQWDAVSEDSTLQDGSSDIMFAKLVWNYINPTDLSSNVLPRLRKCLKDDGLLVAVLPNPLREVAYSKARYDTDLELAIQVGGFQNMPTVTSYHHRYEAIMSAARAAGFPFGAIYGLPEVRFESYHPFLRLRERQVKIAHPFPLLFSTLNAAKRWIFAFGASEQSEENLYNAGQRLLGWRASEFPEIADAVHMRTLGGRADGYSLPINIEGTEALYEYKSEQTRRRLIVTSQVAEHLSARQKLALGRQLIRLKMR